MNITEALNVALPEIPARTIAERFPRVDPAATFKEHFEDGERVMRVYLPSEQTMYKFPFANWALIQLFDGQRSYQEIAQLHLENTGIEYSAEEVREYASELEAGKFWYRTAQEKNILQLQKGTEDRQKRVKAKGRYGDISLILFPAFNPDPFLTWFYGRTRYFYSAWFTALTLMFFAFMAAITISRWGEIGRDTLEFYNFSHKTWGDVVVFYSLAMGILAFHEFGHAHACKHYGARVPAMGFALIYLTPAFYTDTTEGLVQATRYQRLVISVAGVWAELMVCAIATPIWWGTAPDTALHTAAYDAMLITGISSVLLNWNPLMKLDGYHMLCEIIGIANLKEGSTAYVSSWVKRHIWGLPVEVPYVPKRRRLGFVVYALLSGAYSYAVLYVIARFVGNVFRNFNPEWSFIPELLTAGLIFRSRIRTLGNFMKFVYLDKKDRVRAWFTPRRTLAAAGLVLIALFLPLWHESVSGRFLLEPANSAVIRAVTPGIVTAVYATEGKTVDAGTPLVQLRNVPLQSKLALSKANYQMATERANSAVVHFDNVGGMMRQLDISQAQNTGLSAQAAKLNLASPLAGVVLTPGMEDRVGSYVTEGTELAEVGDLRTMRARIYISEYEMSKFKPGSDARLEIDGTMKKWRARAALVSATSSEIDEGLADRAQYKGLNPPHFYLVDLRIENTDSRLKPGMAGLARLYGRRISVAGYLWSEVSDFFGRKLW
jgi:putative peptide zinc metalloprotease protein